MAAVQDGKATGIGFVLGDGWAGIDIDNSITRDPPRVTAEANAVMSAFRSYTELSPSGTGIHIIVHGEVNGGRKVGNIEMYSAGRYFTVTGHYIPTGSSFVENCQEQLDDLALELDKRRAREGRAARNTTSSASLAAQAPGVTAQLPPPASEEAIIERAHSVCQGFPELWAGSTTKYDGDASRADLALAGSLVFMCGRDQHPLVESLMRRSALVRDKWDDHRTYISRTIQRAYEGRDDDSFFDWNRQNRALAVIATGNEELTPGDPDDHGLPLDLTRETTLDDIGFARRLAADSLLLPIDPHLFFHALVEARVRLCVWNLGKLMLELDVVGIQVLGPHRMGPVVG
jgi:primase-polymerase (primpol)-like protein